MVETSTDFEGSIPVVSVMGSITSLIPAPMPGVKELLFGGYKKIIMDASGITYINASGLASIINTHRYCHKQGVHLVIARPRIGVMKTIRIAKANVFIPIYDSVASAVKDIQYHTGPSTRGGKSREGILVLQKNLPIGADLEAILFEAKQHVNYNIDTKTDINDATQALNDNKYELVIFDVNLEMKDAESLLAGRALKPELSAIPFAVVTPHARYEQAFEFILSGADDFMPHPFDEFETPTRIRALMSLFYLAKADASGGQVSGLRLSRTIKSSEPHSGGGGSSGGGRRGG